MSDLTLRKLDPKESELELVRKPPKVSRGCGGVARAALSSGALGKRIAAEGVLKWGVTFNLKINASLLAVALQLYASAGSNAARCCSLLHELLPHTP